jgi:hypothetical protein
MFVLHSVLRPGGGITTGRLNSVKSNISIYSHRLLHKINITIDFPVHSPQP